MALITSAVVAISRAAAQEPEPGLRVTESEFAEHMRVLEIDGFEREAAAAVYREFVDQFEKAWAVKHAAMQWLDQMQGDPFGGYPYMAPDFYRTWNEDFRYFPRAVKAGGRELEADYFEFLAELTPRFADRVESLRRTHVRQRVMHRDGDSSEGAHGWSFDLLDAVSELNGISLTGAEVAAENSDESKLTTLRAAVNEYEQRLQPFVERLDLAQAGLLSWRDEYRRMTWRIQDTGERPDDRDIDRYVDGIVEHGALHYEIRALTRAHAPRSTALLPEVDAERLLHRVRRATQPFVYTAEVDLANTIAAGALARSDLTPQQRRDISSLLAQLELAVNGASVSLEAKYDAIISPSTARQYWSGHIRYGIERAIDDTYDFQPVNPYPLLQAIFDEAVLLWAEEVRGHLDRIRAAIPEASS